MKAQVLLPKVFNFSFTYNSNKEKLIPGDIVEVPFGKNKEIGVVWPGESSVSRDFKIKNINKKISKISLSKNFINFIKWFAMYNVTPLGLVLKMVIGGNKNLFIKNDKSFDQRESTVKKYNLKPFKILNNRGLYKNLSNQFVLKYAFQESNELIDDFTFFSKSIRSGNNL